MFSMSADKNTDGLFKLSVYMKNPYSPPFRHTLCRFALFSAAKIDAPRL
ncbi:MAG: hypothetical protein IJQ81_01920 [Oscillibacter sp.]|nr:hypothetical protein [Oscillospiraceae bacterium]MBR0280331.1 hypothetical protein [Oscillibacter sp.]